MFPPEEMVTFLYKSLFTN